MMKILMMTDMEGVAGILNFDDWCVPEGRYYEKGKRFLTEEVNAAAAGFFDEGADEILVVDGHGRGGIDPEFLDERVRLLRGHFPKIWPWGLDESFNALAFVGQHAKAGTDFSHLTHTQNFGYVGLSINHLSIGEFGQLALCAMELGVPTILACGEKALAEEAEKLTPGVVTVAVKEGLLPDGLEHLDRESYKNAKLSAIHLSPLRARRLIREGASHALRKLRDDPCSFKYPPLSPPYVKEVQLRQIGDKPPSQFTREHPQSIIELMNIR